MLTYFAAMTPLDPTDLVDLYWAGRATLVSRHEDQGVYDRVFRRYFLGADAPAEEPAGDARRSRWPKPRRRW